MMIKFVQREFLALAFLAVSLIAPAANAQQKTVPASPSQQVVAEDHHQPGSEPFIRTQLFFGTDKPDGGDISKDDFRKFLKEEITSRFPAGLTVLTGTGQFRDFENKIIREKSIVLILLYPLDEWKASNEKVEQIRKAYKDRFKQQSVLRVDDPRPVLVSF